MAVRSAKKAACSRASVFAFVATAHELDDLNNDIDHHEIVCYLAVNAGKGLVHHNGQKAWI